MLRPNGSLARNDIILIKCAACGTTIAVRVHEMAVLCIDKLGKNVKDQHKSTDTST